MHRTVRGIAALTAATALVTGGCAATPWPARPTGLIAAALARGALSISTVDVLPVNLQAWGEDSSDSDLDGYLTSAEDVIEGTVCEQLAQRGYRVTDRIGPSGAADGHVALAREDVVATEAALSHYGAAVGPYTGRLPVPFLPVRLGTASNADATLYVGGWAYVAADHDSGAAQVGKAVLVLLAAITVIALVVVAANSKSHGRGSHGGGSHGGGSHGGGSTAAIAAVTARHAGPAIGALRTAGHVAHLVDAFGRTAEGLEIALGAPEWHDDDALPHRGGESQLYLEMTLVDNRTGLALWHTHQTFPAVLGDRSGNARAVRTLLSTLPSHAAPAAR